MFFFSYLYSLFIIFVTHLQQQHVQDVFTVLFNKPHLTHLLMLSSGACHYIADMENLTHKSWCATRNPSATCCGGAKAACWHVLNRIPKAFWQMVWKDMPFIWFYQGTWFSSMVVTGWWLFSVTFPTLTIIWFTKWIQASRAELMLSRRKVSTAFFFLLLLFPVEINSNDGLKVGNAQDWKQTSPKALLSTGMSLALNSGTSGCLLHAGEGRWLTSASICDVLQKSTAHCLRGEGLCHHRHTCSTSGQCQQWQWWRRSPYAQGVKLAVILNAILDSMMGCTSPGEVTKPRLSLPLRHLVLGAPKDHIIME